MVVGWAFSVSLNRFLSGANIYQNVLLSPVCRGWVYCYQQISNRAIAWSGLVSKQPTVVWYSRLRDFINKELHWILDSFKVSTFKARLYVEFITFSEKYFFDFIVLIVHWHQLNRYILCSSIALSYVRNLLALHIERDSACLLLYILSWILDPTCGSWKRNVPSIRPTKENTH